MQRSIPILWGLVIVLVILNVLVLDALNLARLTAVETLGKVEAALDKLANEVIVYNVEVNQAVPVKVDVPFNRTVEIPVNTVIAIDQTLSVPFRTPAGEIVLDMPVKTDVPIDVVIPVNLDETISVDTVVQLNTTLPVKIEIARTPLAAYLREAKSDIARLRARLSLKREAAKEEKSPASSKGGVAESPVSDGEGDSSTQTPPLEAEAATIGLPESPLAADVPDASPQPGNAVSLSAGGASYEAKPDPCSHPYWPMWSGMAWTYNSPATSYTYSVEEVSNNQMLLSTQYEGRDVQSNLVCTEEELGGAYLGDMRRISEIGDLIFSNPRGSFLPRPGTMEGLGESWRQELDVSGAVQASYGESMVEGRISRGRAVAVYTPTRVETVETPLGSREALRIEQRLDLELEIGFELEGRRIPAGEKVSLSNVYWLVKDIGLVKLHWQGGTLEMTADSGGTPTSQQWSVPALPEDELAIVCLKLADQSVKCARREGVDGSLLTAPAPSELEIQHFALMVGAPMGEPAGSAGTSTAEAPGKSSQRDNDERSALLAYAAAVQSLVQRLSEAAQALVDAALAFQGGQITVDELRQEFQRFAPVVREVSGQLNRLSPPPEAQSIHQKLAEGLGKCDQALDLMDNWLDSPNSNAKEGAALLVADCAERVTAAQEELMAFVNED